MKQAAKNLLKRTPGAKQLIQRVKRIDQQMAELQTTVHNLQSRLDQSDNRLDLLRAVANQVEPYQQIYGITGIVDAPRRESDDRGKAIETALNPLGGKRVLDIGSSLGYVSFYLADRGAQVEGWESNAQNCEVSVRAQEINGIPVKFKTKELNLDTVKTIEDNTLDAIVVLNVFHHITYYNDVDYSKKLVRELFKKAPVMIVELAKKGEDKKLRWDKSQPEDELDIFDLVKEEVEIVKIGEFPNHLSNHTRPLYVVKKKNLIEVNGRSYHYDRTSNLAYKESPLSQHPVHRRYYFGEKVVIKEYLFDKGIPKDAAGQILNEIQLFINLEQSGVRNMVTMANYEVRKDRAIVVMDRVAGDLLSEKEKISEKQLVKYLKQTLVTLSDLEALGVHHNDIRQWNIMIDDKDKAWLIDYGLAGGLKRENDVLSLLYSLVLKFRGEQQSSHIKTKVNSKKLAEMLPISMSRATNYIKTSKNPTAKELLNNL
jgi:serine/threonine protein kinase